MFTQNNHLIITYKLSLLWGNRHAFPPHWKGVCSVLAYATFPGHQLSDSSVPGKEGRGGFDPTEESQLLI